MINWVFTLHQSALLGHKKTIESLIASGEDVNAKDKDGHTPLHYAARDGRKEIAEILITMGAHLNAKGKNSETPLDWANFYNHREKETAALLRKHGGKTKKELEAEGK